MEKNLLLLCILLAGCLSVNGQNIAIEDAIKQQMRTYPASELQDLYKFFFQDAFGPGHLMSNATDAEEKMRQYLKTECEIAKKEANLCPDYERTGADGNFYRVNLSVINDGRVPFDIFLSAFTKSTRQFTLPKIDDWARQWKEIEQIVNKLGYRLPRQAEDSMEIHKMLKEGKYVVHHSQSYNNAYHPHYRLIERNLFDKEILPLLSQEGKVEQLSSNKK